MIVLGIDPGSSVTGYGILQSDSRDERRCITFGCIRSRSKEPFYLRLKKIYDEIGQLIEGHRPGWVALEDIFYSRNIKSVLQLGQARGAAILAAVNAQCSISLYSPREVKQALTGYGAASKEQVQSMVFRLLQLSNGAAPLDASDALAIAICHINRFWTQQNLNDT